MGEAKKKEENKMKQEKRKDKEDKKREETKWGSGLHGRKENRQIQNSYASTEEKTKKNQREAKGEVEKKNKKNAYRVKKSKTFKEKKRKSNNDLKKSKENFHIKNERNKLSRNISKDKNKYKKLMNRDGAEYTRMMNKINQTSENRKESVKNGSFAKISGKKRLFSESNTTKRNEEYIFKQECDEILKNENLSESKKRKLIKELRKKNVKKHYHFEKELKCSLNKLSQSKEAKEKEKYANEMIRLLETCDVVSFGRTNLGFHIFNSLNINAADTFQKKIGSIILKNMKECCTNVYTSLTFQSFYKYGKKEVKSEMEKWLMEHPQSLLTKFGSRLWCFIYKMATKTFQRKMVNSLILPNAKELKKVSPTIINKKPMELYNELNDTYKDAIKKKILDIIDAAVNKELLYNTVIHQLLSFSCSIFKDKELTNLMETIHEGCEYLIPSEAGNKALILLLGYSNNKQKKSLIKVVKNDIVDLCKNCINYLLVIRLLKITDDTKVLNQYIVKKIVENMESVVTNTYGYYVIMSFFYQLDEKSKDTILSSIHKELVYADSPNSVKDPEKRKKEILDPVVNALSTIFKDKNKLKNYLKQKKYLYLIHHLFLNAECDTVLENIISIFLELVPSFTDEGNLTKMTQQTEMKKKKKKKTKKKDEIDLISEQDLVNQQVINIHTLFRKFIKENTENFLEKNINEKKIYVALCECFISNIHIILNTRLICFFTSLINYVKENDETLFKNVMKQAKNIKTEEIYEDLKKKNVSVNKFEEYMQLLK